MFLGAGKSKATCNFWNSNNNTMCVTFFQIWGEWSRKRIPDRGREYQQWCMQFQETGSYHLSMRWYSKSLFSFHQMKSLENLYRLRLSKIKSLSTNTATVKSQLNCIKVCFFKKIQDWILESKNGFCISLLNRSIQDHSYHGTLKKPTNPLWTRILWVLCCTMIQEVISSKETMCRKGRMSPPPSKESDLSDQ